MNTGAGNTIRNGRSGLSREDTGSDNPSDLDSIPSESSQLDARTSLLMRAFECRWPLAEWTNKTVLVGVSGGSDSMALLELILRHAADFDRVKVLHCNHGLRGDESDHDEAFVIDTCLERGIECLSVRIDPSELSSSSEETLRRIRFKHYVEAAKAFDARWIALGHHRDDNLETFFLRLFRGSGPRGLSGIPLRRSVPTTDGRPLEIIRPMLSISKSELEAWLADQGIPFREDSSNRLGIYQRNRLRNELIPILDSLYGEGWRKHVLQVIESMTNQTQASELEANRILAEHWNRPLPTKDTTLPLSIFQQADWNVTREIVLAIWHSQHWSLRPWTRKHWQRLQQFFAVASQTPHPKRIELPGKIVAKVRKGVVTFEQTTDA